MISAPMAPLQSKTNSDYRFAVEAGTLDNRKQLAHTR